MTNTMTIIDTYFDMWNETDPVKRGELIERVWTDDGRHVDPLADVAGHGALDHMIAGVQSHYPGHVLRRTSGIDAHHEQIRYGWELAGSDGTIVVSAIDIGELADDGRLRRVTAFFGELPQAHMSGRPDQPPQRL